MQLQIKTLSNEKFAIECESTDTVRSIKEKIAATNLKDKYEADAVKLIFSGKILEDDKTLQSYSINGESFLVVVKQTPPKPSSAAAPAANPSSSSAAPTNVQQPTPAAASASAVPAQQQQQQPAQSQPTQASGTAPTGGASDSFLSAETREKALRELTDMGFERAQAELALRASFYHVERAAEYLITGEIPSFNEGQGSSQGGAPGQPSSGGSESSVGSRRTGGGGAEDLSELSQNPQFLALRQLIQQNPEQLQTLMQTLQATQPELYQLIEQRPQEFLELLNQVDEGDDEGEGDDLPQGGGPGGQGPPGTVTITLSPQDQQAINRLQDMGFDRNRVIEAFLACDRNEELAANYLLSSFD